MSTVTTRSLNGNDKDVVAIKADSQNYVGKTGCIELVVNSYSWGSGSPAADVSPALDLRNPNFCPNNDTPIVNNLNLGYTSGTTTVAKKYYFAVNNGVIGPAAYQQADGTWDLLNVTFSRVGGTGSYSLSADYTLNFYDETPSSTNPSDTGTLVLSVDNIKVADQAHVTDVASAYTSKNGYTKVQLNALDISAIDCPINDPFVTNPQPGDSVPLFACLTRPSIVGFGFANDIATHPTSKHSGTKVYQDKLFIFAINSGLIDGNGNNYKSPSPAIEYFNLQFQKIRRWPCDDLVTATVHYTLTFVQKT